MIINCNKCRTKFNLNNNLIPEKGRLLQCGKCENKWFFKIKQTTNDKQSIVINDTEISISKEKPSEIIIENNNHEIESDNVDEFITHKKKYDGPKRILTSLFVIIITFVAIIIVADTFKQNLSSLLPGLLPLLDNLYETLYDLQLFIKDLLK
jgi:predicted Zn finger-like uncharacterized protein